MTKPAPITRVKLDHCSVAGCPRPDSEAFHRNVCGHQDRPPTHEHHPKKGMGGKNPLSEIRCCICAECHDLADNFGGSGIVQTKDGKRYIGWQGHDSDPIKRKILWDVPLDAHELVVEDPDSIGEETDVISSGSGQRTEASDLSSRVGDHLSVADTTRYGSGPEKRSPGDRDNHFTLTEQGIDFSECTFDDWKSAWSQVAGLSRNRQWWVGDAWNYAEERWPEQHGQIADELTALAGLRIETISNYANVAKAFPKARRRMVSFDHHATVYRLSPKKQDKWLDRAEAEGLSSTELRALVHPPEPKPKRWSIEELREAWQRWTREPNDPARKYIGDFLDWLEEPQE